MILLFYANINWVKIGISATIGIALTANHYFKSNNPEALPSKPIQAIQTGFVSGVMVSCLSMAGPAVAIYMQSLQREAIQIRATIFAVFMFAYPIAISLQIYQFGLSQVALTSTIFILPMLFLVHL